MVLPLQEVCVLSQTLRKGHSGEKWLLAVVEEEVVLARATKCSLQIRIVTSSTLLLFDSPREFQSTAAQRETAKALASQSTA